MSVSINKTLLVGRVGKYPFVMRALPNGTPVARGSIVVAEPCRDGRQFETFIAVHVHGQHAEAATTLRLGQPIMVDGKLAKHKAKDGSYETIVACYRVQVLGSATVPVTLTDDMEMQQ